MELIEILKVNPSYKSKYQISIQKNIKKLNNGREKILNFVNDYARMVLDAKHKSIHVKGLKIVTLISKITNSTCTSESR